MKNLKGLILMNCDLCNLEKKTKWYYEDEKIVICDCTTCKIPMVVLRKHTMKPTENDIEHICSIARKLFGDVMFRVDQRRIRDHLHWHLIQKENKDPVSTPG